MEDNDVKANVISKSGSELVVYSLLVASNDQIFVPLSFTFFFDSCTELHHLIH